MIYVNFYDEDKRINVHKEYIPFTQANRERTETKIRCGVIKPKLDYVRYTLTEAELKR